ncbi:TPA: hypothetical protein PCO50_001837 [Klebsiella pneumoniae]|nr:hypothetical protein [Klebsiella pneumoniae]HDG8081902.1 hypothetical protein [Klebsiella pneumoniae]
MNIETVNELIRSLESAGELSIREQNFLKLAKAYQQLAAENVALSKDAQRYRFIRERDMFGSDNESGLLSWEELAELECNEFDDALDARINHPNTGFIELDAKMQARKTPATDRIVAGIKADGAKFIFQSILDNPAVTDLGSLVDWLEQHDNDSAAAVRAMREGAK